MGLISWAMIFAGLAASCILVLTFAVPKKVSGALLLKKEMRLNRVEVANLPPEFFADCVQWAEGVAKFGSSGPVAQRAELVRSIENLARMAALWVAEPDSAMFVNRGSSKNGYRQLFEKYNLKAIDGAA